MLFKINTLEDWQMVVDAIIPKLQHRILLLKGNLGAGKTTFSQFLLKSLGSTDEVSSPTYTIVNEYNTPNGVVFHFDLYRMKSVEEVYDIGMEDYLDNARLCIIEWPDIYEDDLEENTFHTISIDNNEGVREIKFS